MFGYVLPGQDKLADDDKERFQAIYCGLCHTLGSRYGLVGRMVLNYDLTFMAMLLQQGKFHQCQRHCLIHPIKRRCCACEDTALDFSADLSIILTWWQLQDGIADHGLWKGLKYRVASLLLRRAYKKARKSRPVFDNNTRLHLQELSKLEHSMNATLDAPADTFARLLSGVAQFVDEPTKRRVLETMLYHLGRWIYIIDAADDLQRDLKNNSYNPIPLRYGVKEMTEMVKKELGMTLDDSVRTMAAAFELWDFGDNTSILRTVVYQGLYGVGHAVLNGTFRRKHRDNRKGE